MDTDVTSVRLTHQTMVEYIHYTSIVAEIVQLYARNEEGARYGDKHCCGAQLACNRLIDEFAAYNPKIKELYNEIRDKYVDIHIGELEREG